METTPILIKEKLTRRICRMLAAQTPKDAANEAVNFIQKLTFYYVNNFNAGLFKENDPIRELYHFIEDKSLLTSLSQVLAWGLALKKIQNLECELPRGIDLSNDIDETVRIFTLTYKYLVGENFPSYEPPTRKWNLGLSILRLEAYIARRVSEIEHQKNETLQIENQKLTEQLSIARRNNWLSIIIAVIGTGVFSLIFTNI